MLSVQSSYLHHHHHQQQQQQQQRMQFTLFPLYNPQSTSRAAHFVTTVNLQGVKK